MEGGYGLISCIPIVVLLVSVLWTRRIFECILVSIFIALFISEGITGILWTFRSIWFIRCLQMKLIRGYCWCCCCLADWSNCLRKSGGTFLDLGFLQQSILNLKKAAFLATFILGILIFIDDYLNNLTIGSAMRGITDQYKVPREMLAITIITTGAPICVLNPFSTWAVFIFGLMQSVGMAADETLISRIYQSWSLIFFMQSLRLRWCRWWSVTESFQIEWELKKAYARASGGSSFSWRIGCKQRRVWWRAGKNIRQNWNRSWRNFRLPMLVVVTVTLLTERSSFPVSF